MGWPLCPSTASAARVAILAMVAVLAMVARARAAAGDARCSHHTRTPTRTPTHTHSHATHSLSDAHSQRARGCLALHLEPSHRPAHHVGQHLSGCPFRGGKASAQSRRPPPLIPRTGRAPLTCAFHFIPQPSLLLLAFPHNHLSKTSVQPRITLPSLLIVQPFRSTSTPPSIIALCSAASTSSHKARLASPPLSRLCCCCCPTIRPPLFHRRSSEPPSARP